MATDDVSGSAECLTFKQSDRVAFEAGGERPHHEV